MLLLLLACGPKEEPAVGTVFYCRDALCGLACDTEPCVRQRRASCAWFMSGSSFLCYPDPEACEEAREELRSLKTCEWRTPQEMLPR
jgi:hypothetical protein